MRISNVKSFKLGMLRKRVTSDCSSSVDVNKNVLIDGLITCDDVSPRICK
jgi:hypothetical protein